MGLAWKGLHGRFMRVCSSGCVWQSAGAHSHRAQPRHANITHASCSDVLLGVTLLYRYSWHVLTYG